MSDAGRDSHGRQGRLQQILAEYLEAEDAGCPPSRKEYLARYPEFAKEIAEFLAGQEQWSRLVAPLRHVRSASLPSTEPYSESPAADSATHGVALRPTSARREPIERGKVFAGEYRITDARVGGMGRVYFAQWVPAEAQSIDARVALKTVDDFEPWRAGRLAKGRPADEGAYRDILERFRREAESWIHLEPHDNVLLAFQVIDVGAKPYLVMDYANSGDLQSWIKAGRLTVPLALNYAIQFCRGMAHVVRTAGMVHRDIKPANVLIKDTSVVKIADFGLSKCLDHLAERLPAKSDLDADTILSQHGGGTLPYMAPEQFEDLAQADTRSDIFSFGAMLYEMLTGCRLFDAPTAWEQFLLRSRPLPAAHHARPEVPPALSRVIARAVSFEPSARYQSFEEILGDLERIYDALPDRLPFPRDPCKIPSETRFAAEVTSLIALGAHEKALRRADDAIRQFPESAHLWANKAIALARLDQLDEAILCICRALSIQDDQADTWVKLALIQLDRRQPVQALQAALRAIHLDANLAGGWLARGCCDMMLDRIENAVRWFRRGLELNPDNWRNQHRLGICLGLLRQEQAALAAFRRVVQINPGFGEAWMYLASLLGEAGRVEEAKGMADRAIAIDPSNATAWAVRGLLSWQYEGDAARARPYLEKALQLNPNATSVQSIVRVCQPVWWHTAQQQPEPGYGKYTHDEWVLRFLKDPSPRILEEILSLHPANAESVLAFFVSSYNPRTTPLALRGLHRIASKHKLNRSTLGSLLTLGVVAEVTAAPEGMPKEESDIVQELLRNR